MKKVLMSLLIVIFIISGCALLNMYSSGQVKTSTAFDLEAGTEIDLSDCTNDDDLCLEPWYKDGNPAPGLQMLAWGDSMAFIFDLGKLSIADAGNLTEDDLIPDSIEWDVYVEEEHTYYIITTDANEYFLYAKTLTIDEDPAGGYDATLEFDYKAK